MIKQDTVRLLELSAQQSLDTPAGTLAAVSLLSQALESLMHDVFLSYLRTAGSAVTDDHIARLKLLQYRSAAQEQYILTPEDKELLVHLHVNLVSGLTEIPPGPDIPAKKTILVVDDEPHIRQYLARILEHHGINTLLAGDGTEAIALFRKKKPDLVFLDVVLPDMDGLQILAKMKEIDTAVPIFFVTGARRETFQKEAVRLGVTGYLTKPVDLSSLITIVRNL